MVSDVLAEAIIDIKDYQKTMPDSYECLGGELDAVTTVMDIMRLYLDTEPHLVQRHAEVFDKLRAMLLSIDVASMKAMRDQFYAWCAAERKKNGVDADSETATAEF